MSVARIPLLRAASAGRNSDPTWTSTYGIMFTIFVPSAVLMCACLPMCHGLFSRLPKVYSFSNFTSLFRSSKSRSGQSGSGRSREFRSNNGNGSQPAQYTRDQNGWVRMQDGSGKSAGVKQSEEYELSDTHLARKKEEQEYV